MGKEERSSMDPTKKNWRQVLFLSVVGIILLVFPHIFTLPFPQHIMIMIFLYATLAQAWNIVGGYAGQCSLGHAIRICQEKSGKSCDILFFCHGLFIKCI